MKNTEFIIQVWHVFAFFGCYFLGILTVISIIRPLVKRTLKEIEYEEQQKQTGKST